MKFGSPEGAFPASYGDGYGLHSVWFHCLNCLFGSSLLLDRSSWLLSSLIISIYGSFVAY